MTKVTKRNGNQVEFNKEKIVEAIKKAMQRTAKGTDIELATKIACHVEKLNKNFTVEEIQDIVELKLMGSCRKDVAKEYVTYRETRSRQREADKELYKKTSDILECKNITNDNANVDQNSFSGRESRVGSVLHKQYAMNNLLTNDIRQSFNDGYIYIHDFDKYAVGSHNCLFVDVANLLKNGFSTRNGDVRGANSISTAFQLIAVIFQCQSQVQFGGVASCHIDYDLAPFVKKSFAKYLKAGIKWAEKLLSDEEKETAIAEIPKSVSVTDIIYKEKYPTAFSYAEEMIYKEGLQGAQALYHNLNTLESRAGSQVPFTSINYGRDTSREGQLVTEWILKASIDGIGKFNKTSIFPIGIFQYKKGINDKEGTPNYYLKQLAIKSMSKRIYPNWVNCDFSQHKEDPNDIDTIKATMGCRTQLGKDQNGLGYCQKGRGNICPTTIILPKLGIEYGVCEGKRTEADMVGFWYALDKILDITRDSLLNRFAYISGQHPASAPFMYGNKTIADASKCNTNVYDALKHGTLAIGFIGLAEMCQALFGENFVHNDKIYEFALSVVQHIYDYAKNASAEYKLNFSCYATPAEGLCETSATKLRNEYGIIPFVTDKKYLTNSSHVPVWEKITAEKKLELEAPFTFYELGGCITYVELSSSLAKNPKGVETLIDRAMDLDIPYLAINFPIDTCLSCGYQDEMNDVCPTCDGGDIEHIARVTGYLSTDVSHFNKGKQAEVVDRVTHELTVNFGEGKGV